jgi:hypothetical protein
MLAASTDRETQAMATTNTNDAATTKMKAAARAKAPSPAAAAAQAAIARYLPLEKTFKDALALMKRFREAQGFSDYLRRRMPMVAPAVALFAMISIACACAVVIFLADRHPMLALPGLILAPFVLLGSMFVQMFAFFSWLESRALAQALGHRVSRRQGFLSALITKKLHLDLGEAPRVPWGLAAVFLILPVALLFNVAVKAAVVLVVLAVLLPFVFARFDK